MLFSSDERTRKTSRRYNESNFSFLDSSAWPSVERVRQFWQGWFAQYDDGKKPGLAARFQSYDNHPHLSAFLELFTFAILKHSGYEIEIEPPAGSRNLEFLASRDEGNVKFYVECTATGQRAAEVSADAREAEVLEAIDKVPTRQFLLQVEVEGRGSQAASLKRLRAELTSWLASLDYDVHETNQLSEWTWAESDWRIKFCALPTKAELDDDEGALGVLGPQELDMTQHLRLRRAVDGKASKYGQLDNPLLVVTNSTEFQRERDLMKALLGDIVWDVNFGENHVSERFLWNGVFGSLATPRNVVLSAVMHGTFSALSFADRPMILFHHPFAMKTLTLGLFPFCEERHFDRQTGQLTTTPPTMSIGDFFSLPSGWPFFELDPR